MSATTLGIKVDDTQRQRIHAAAQQIGRTPHWLVKQAALLYVDAIERGVHEIRLQGLPGSAPDEAEEVPPPAPHEVQPFLAFAQSILPQTPLRAAITAGWHRPEPECLAALLPQARAHDDEQAAQVRALATRLVQGLREAPVTSGVAALVQEFSLSSQEGVALMCLAEALLRIPDRATRDALIRDKISHGDWRAHVGRSPSLFVNAAAWGLVLTGKLTATSSEKTLSAALTRVIGKGGEPLIRQGVHRAMKLMGEQFVTGQNIAEALANSRAHEKQGFRYSYDMLGEAATTEQDAQRYLADYQQAIHAIGSASNGRGIFDGPGISIKLSALHPRYARGQYERVMSELLPRVLHLAELARQYDIGMNIDAEEADRLELSLDLLEALCAAPSLKGWSGIGFVVQAYQKRCPQVIDYLVDLARRSRRRLMVRLVKGAYWDSEIKRSQIDGHAGYPVYTRKAYTDVSYLACAKKLLSAPDAVYPQFATHNAQTLASIHHLAQAVGGSYYSGQYEFQCLHGMGEPLYAQVVGPTAEGKLARPCRIYAPVGNHETLLAYLVRRLLENGANTSFVNRIGDTAIAVSELVQDPVQEVLRIAQEEGQLGAPHPRIALPIDLYAGQGVLARTNSQGLNLANEQRLASLAVALLQSTSRPWFAAAPGVATPADPARDPAWEPVRNPAELGDVVGWVREASAPDVDAAARRAAQALPIWAGMPPSGRADVLLRSADLLEQRGQTLMGLVQREAGKTLASALCEVREAADFMRYYGAQVAAHFDNAAQRPLGVVLAISPWNFPLAIFAGQVAAALAAGNAVLAKPAEQTPLTAAAMVAIFHEAGVPHDVLQLLPGRGETVGAQLVAHPQVAGVMFTGSTEVARLINRQLATRLSPSGRVIPLIAETGGLNAMVVDSSALAEQVVLDVLASAFDSAGQRCSALRLLCLQEDVAERQMTMLKAALQEWSMGNPDRLSTDIGPVIDEAARAQIESHIEAMQAAGQKVTRLHQNGGNGHFVAPAIIEIDSPARLTREVFGPVLHVLRYERERLDELIERINAAGYGLTFGVHSRIDETIDHLTDRVHAGNVYVNRNIIGAVVGVQPFGGMGLSGTGPKAGGPLYLYRLVQGEPGDALALLPRGQAAEQGAGHGAAAAPELAPIERLLATTLPEAEAAQARVLLDAARRAARMNERWLLPGPTGESNVYRLLPRGPVWAMPATALGLLAQVAAALASGNECHVVLPEGDAACASVWQALHRALGEDASRLKPGARQNLGDAAVPVTALLFEGDGDALAQALAEVAAREGAIVRVESRASFELQSGRGYDLAALVHEQSISTNTAAAGGNAQLMTMA
ncbi:MAG: trifunctional transcriptional regulator/proline dehydrogenase/L-glutamate gamma-semialdehyde dehydrogenase [Comamonas sp. SCN 65-56]|uniref:trifunctional transcriptional regulator/proline dehydrogenase/L-glutamate gamma-semialdehyde dehydrogenase n=1 Tax=Comamonas sp. SCN 65-56 TaxID=1660095 RepID=UPI00086B1F9F|nr:trifunctional transcriptional regulator/proline dehydrogenase/L-glutamate gamma-semialdehyde dehydrogenase [Comamonas sp. SCN 65-56]ODS91064.1 MAG: trifunctional transcriptional regulator/proline dehydrogenase/L-glutamate gamma-semialdehyde dehydrogenase [Comamonas sp. SCN 65-56]